MALLRREELHAQRRKEEREKAPDKITRGSLTLDVIACQAFADGKDMCLTPKEFAILLALVQNEGNILAKEVLYGTVWNAPTIGDDNALKINMSRLRKKLEGVDGFRIAALRGEGYRFELYDGECQE